ncbi:leucine-rich repeat-containing protein 47-like [Sitodiplosis mosellana]|uniref:leucine-rich repeat-containing protein 47-like n=1 Tax=Sitodiplosis mosellana TaxID=263140 RepID=UPI00244444BD|nr:leucine-rich repeat-containing protein 47-like [Sitodiplosis mosellana]
MWREIQQAKDENKREIKLAGAEISERIEKDGIDISLFALDALNLLNISDTSLKVLPLEISNLINLQTLLLYGNEIATIPDSIDRLEKLKVLDLSRNKLENVPHTITKLHNLTTINISNNQLTAFPALNNFTKLSVIDLSGNQLTEFPDIYSSDNNNLSEIYLKENSIESIPHVIDQLVSLKHFSMAKNKVNKIPKSLANITKLKDLDLSENPVADKRLLKLIQQCRTKQVLDYVKQHGEDAPKSSENDSSSGQNKKQGKNKKSKKSESSDEPKHKLSVKRHNDDTIKVIFDDAVKDVRQFILCCIVENVNLNNGKFREFLQIQTKLHETVCGKREKSTIATHDLQKLPRPLAATDQYIVHYTAKDAKSLKIQPLNKNKVVTAQSLYNELKAEAEAIRKQKQRNTYSGIHKYLKLLENKTQFSCVEDGLGNVISLPPLTNGETTKISPESTQIFIEITSHSAMADCVDTMEALLKAMLLAGLGASQNDSCDTTSKTLDIRQVKVTDAEGNLRRVYPAKSDLVIDESENIGVERE